MGADSENEWFAKHEAELLRQARRSREHRETANRSKEAEQRRSAHWMKCPKCGFDLAHEKFGSVEVDVCGDCGGIFLDRGELDTLLLEDRGAQRGFFRRLVGLD